MQDLYPPTDVSPHGPFPEGTAFFEDETDDLFVLLPGVGLYEVRGDKLDPTDREHRDGFMNNFFSSGTELRELEYLQSLAKR